MPELVRYGIIGTGMMGCDAHRSIDEGRPVSLAELEV